MTDQKIFNLKIDEGFKNLIPPLSKNERKQLEEDILRDGCREPLCVWGNTILDDFYRYEICTRLQIPFSTVRIPLQNREEALSWICTNQLNRIDISEEARRYLIGKRYDIEKILGAHHAAGTSLHTKKGDRPQILTEPRYDETALRTAQRLGDEYHISYAAVQRYSLYARAIDTLSKAVPDLIPKILSGQMKISQKNTVQLSRLSVQEIRHLSEHLSSNCIEFVGYSDTRYILPEKSDLTEQTSAMIPIGSIKDMPVYDPDVEISSLSLTIPSWVSSINRTRSFSNLENISNNARGKLVKELLRLQEAIETMLAAIKEED